MGQRL